MEENSIESIFVRPRNKYYCEYLINDSNSIHIKTYDDIKQYLYDIIPERFTQVNYALMKFQSFIIQVPEKEFVFLQLSDIEEHLDEIEDEVKNPSLKEAMRSVQLKNKMTYDDKIKAMSELEV